MTEFTVHLGGLNLRALCWIGLAMPKIIERALKYPTSNAVKALNPGFFGIAPSSTIKPSKPLISNPSEKLGHSRNDLAGKFLSIWQLLNGPKLEEEFRFHPERKFRADFCHITTRTCIEIEGGIFSKKGGHSSISGILRDIDKYNELSFLGFRLFRFHGKKEVAGSIDVPNLTRLIRFLERPSVGRA